MRTFFTCVALLATITLTAKDIKLPEPNTKRSTKSMMETLASRHSVREFSTKPLSHQELSDLCWAAFGVTRGGKFRTAPTAMNKQEIRLFVLTEKGSYEYDAQRNILKEIDRADNRKLLAKNDMKAEGRGQDFVCQAPVGLVVVIDFDISGNRSERMTMMGCVDAGNVSENINLYCEAAGLATVPRATMDVEALRQVLHLTENQLPIMNNPVGFPL